MKLNEKFYSKDAIWVAKNLLGKIVIRTYNNIVLKAKIVETEAYTGINDKASHAYNGRRTERNEVMWGKSGYAYVYLIYGMYDLLNFITDDINIPAGVLIRAIEPIYNLDEMSKNRYKKIYSELNSYQKRNLTNGPGKLTKALNIDRKLNGINLIDNELYVEDKKDINLEIIETKRIGIDYAEEAKDYPYRFYIKGNTFVSKK